MLRALLCNDRLCCGPETSLVAGSSGSNERNEKVTSRHAIPPWHIGAIFQLRLRATSCASKEEYLCGLARGRFVGPRLAAGGQSRGLVLGPVLAGPSPVLLRFTVPS